MMGLLLTSKCLLVSSKYDSIMASWRGPADIAYGSLHPCPDEAAYLTGMELPIDVGWSAARAEPGGKL